MQTSFAFQMVFEIFSFYLRKFLLFCENKEFKKIINYFFFAINLIIKIKPFPHKFHKE